MSELKIAIVLGSTRPGRRGAGVAQWLMERAKTRTDADYELIDLVDYPLPHMDEPIPPSQARYSNKHTKDWAAKIAGFDGFVFVTPEYNHSIPGVLKNAIDFVYAEWNNKAAAVVSYGTLGGSRAVEHLRGILSAVKIAHVHQQLSFSVFTDFEESEEGAPEFTPAPHFERSATVMFDQVESWSRALATIRA